VTTMPAQQTASGLRIRRLAHGLGATVNGVDFNAPLPTKVRDEISAAWAEHLLLVFPDADIDLEQHIAFSRNFGELELHPLRSLRHQHYPEIIEVTNRVADGKPSETGEVGRIWHSDGAYTTRPPTGSLLHCRALPSAGGTTWFNNMYLAYETLSPGMQRFADSHEVVNDLLGPGIATPFMQSRRDNLLKQDREDTSEVAQPMVRVHPVTGRKALYLNPNVTRRIVDMTAEESRGILDFLFQHCVRPEFVYCHYWQLHDLMVWDNRCSMHIAPRDYDHSEVRQMYRTTLIGEQLGRHLK